MIKALEKPTPPADSECCESGCTPCVWDTYYEELRLWREQEISVTTDISESDKSNKTKPEAG